MKKMINKAFCVLIMIITYLPFIAQGSRNGNGGRPDVFYVENIKYSFENDSSKYVHVSGSIGPLTSITIPRSVVCEYYDTNDCDEDGNATLKRITCIVTGIGCGAFSGYSSLTSVTIPDSFTSIGDSAFNGCTALDSVVLPSTIISIGAEAFNGCTALADVSIPKNTLSIRAAAFAGTKIKEVTVNKSCSYFEDSFPKETVINSY